MEKQNKRHNLFHIRSGKIQPAIKIQLLIYCVETSSYFSNHKLKYFHFIIEINKETEIDVNKMIKI